MGKGTQAHQTSPRAKPHKGRHQKAPLKAHHRRQVQTAAAVLPTVQIPTARCHAMLFTNVDGIPPMLQHSQSLTVEKHKHPGHKPDPNQQEPRPTPPYKIDGHCNGTKARRSIESCTPPSNLHPTRNNSVNLNEILYR